MTRPLLRAALLLAVLLTLLVPAATASAAPPTDYTGWGSVTTSNGATWTYAWRWDPAAGWQQSWRWNQTRVWIAPFATGWSWTWAVDTGWLAMRAADVSAAAAPVVTTGGAKFPGHAPGKICLGMSSTTFATKLTELGRSVCVRRSFNDWNGWASMERSIKEDHAAGRIPWVSFKPPFEDDPPAGWRSIASGQQDAALHALATMLKANDDTPVIITFHHEPDNDGTNAQGAEWAAAYSRVHDVLKADGALANVSDPPVVMDWMFSPKNASGSPASWLKPSVLSRMPFIGVDMYENNTGDGYSVRIPKILDWVAAQGYPNRMIGIGETGCTDKDYAQQTAAQCINANLTWAKANTDKVAFISYYNSPLNSKPNVYWPLDESAAKIAAFRSWIDDPTFLPN